MPLLSLSGDGEVILSLTETDIMILAFTLVNS